MKLIAYKTTALAFTGALAVASPTRADEMQVSGSQVLTVIDPRMIPGTGEQPRNLGSQIVIGATTSPGWFDSMQASYVETFLGNPKLGQSEEKGYGVWTNSDGTMFNSFAGAATFTMDEKTNAPKGNFKGTWEITGGTGHFANVRGHGTYEGTFSGPNSTNHWSGTVTGFEKRASTQ